MTNDQTIEKLVQASGAIAPRVTPQDIEKAMHHVEYVRHVTPSGKVLRWCVITTQNGFAVTGKPSASVSVENDRAEIGEQVALQNARDSLWELLGYELQTRLHKEAGAKDTEQEDFLANSKACDLSGEGTCESCQ